MTDKGHYDSLQKNVNGVIDDSLTPFFRKMSIVDIRDDAKEGGALAVKIEEMLRKENLNNVMILFGGRGSGKSSFIERLLFYIKPQAIENYAITAIVDLLGASQNEKEINREIWQSVCNSIDKTHLLNGSKKELLKLFDDRFSTYKRQVLDGIPENDVDYQKEINKFIRERRADVKYCSQRLSHNWKTQRRGLIIVLDNLDQLPPNLQDICFLSANEVAQKLNCLVIVSMREERYYNAKSRGVLDAYVNPGFHLASPVIPVVVSRRIKYILKKLENPHKLDFDYASKQLPTIINFLNLCYKELKRKDSALSHFLRYSTHGDVRQALEFFKGFLTSGYTNINEMAVEANWRIQPHQVLKPVMIPERFFYDERKSKIPNLFQLRNETISSHFCGLRILKKLNDISHEKQTSGFIDAKYLVHSFESEYELKEDCEKHLDIFLDRGLVEASNRLENYSDSVDQIRITAFGKYMYEHLIYDFTYLDLISLDCGIHDLTLHNYYVKAAEEELRYYYEGDFMKRIHSRIERVEKFLDYLKKYEDKEFEDLRLPSSEVKFSEKIQREFMIRKEKILISAERKRHQY